MPVMSCYYSPRLGRGWRLGGDQSLRLSAVKLRACDERV